MTQEDKKLLLKDICARLPYWTKCWSPIAGNNLAYLTPVLYGNTCNCSLDGEFIKPYLRPMSSMTEEEIVEYDKLFTIYSDGDTCCENWEWMDFMNSHHFNYRGLIEKGLALKAPEGMYNLKENKFRQ